MSPNYISIEGELYAAKEKVGLKKKGGEPYIYEGADRAALFELYKAGEEKFGQNFRHDGEFLHRIKQLGFNTIDDYLKAVDYDSEKSKKDAEKKAKIVNKHDLPKKVKAIETMGGGLDTAGDQSTLGGFGEEHIGNKKIAKG